MPKPELDSLNWGQTLNDHLDAMADDIADKATVALVATKQNSADLPADVAAEVADDLSVVAIATDDRVETKVAADVATPASAIGTAVANAVTAGVDPIRPDNSARAVGKGELTFNVLDYGAISGGAGDDTAAFQAAVDAAAALATAGAEVFIPPGEFHITTVAVPDRVKIRGAGQRASKVTRTSGAVGLEIGKENTLSDFYLTGTATAGSVGVRFRTASVHSTLRDMTISGHETGVEVIGSYILNIRDTNILSCTTGLEFKTTACNIVTVTGGEIQGCTNGVVISSTVNFGLKFLGTTVEGNSNKGFAVNGSTYGLSIRDCYMESNTNGHVVFGGSGHFGPVIEGSVLLNAATFGVSAPDGVSVRDITVAGNTFNLNTVGAKTIDLGTSVIAARVGTNHYVSGSVGTFDAATNFRGTRLVLENLGRITLPPSAATQGAGGAPFNIPHGTAPTTPANGDMWTTTAGLYVRINGVTVGPLS